MEKKYFTKEQLKRLAVAEQNFYTAVKENYKRGTMQTINNLVAEEYEKTTGEKLNRNWNCGTCCLNNFKTVGRLYFESKKYWEEQEKQEQQQQLTFDFEGANNDAVQDETEPALKTKELEKTVADDIDQVQNTPSTIVLDDTQQVQEETEVKQTKSKVFNNKPKGGRPKGSKNKKK